MKKLGKSLVIVAPRITCPHYGAILIKYIAAFLKNGRRAHRFYNHISASEVNAHVGQQLWDDYFKFCVERNPWDRLVSLYYWKHKAKPLPTFSEFIASDNPLILKRKGFELYTNDGQIAVNKVCRLENISEELETIRSQLGSWKS